MKSTRREKQVNLQKERQENLQNERQTEKGTKVNKIYLLNII